MTMLTRLTLVVFLLIPHFVTTIFAQEASPASKNEASEKKPQQVDDKAKTNVALREKIQKSWNQRLAVIKSARFNLETTYECNALYYHTRIAPSLRFLKSLTEEGRIALKQAENYAYAEKTELLFDGLRIRFTRSGQKPLKKAPHELEDYFRLSVTDGKISKAFFGESAELGVASGFIHNSTSCGAILNKNTLAIRAWIDPGRQDFCRLIGRVPLGEIATVSSKSNRLISLVNHGDSMHVNPEQNFSIVMWEGVNHKGGMILEIENQLDEQTKLWVPHQWKIIEYMRDGSVGLKATTRVTKYEINPSFAESDFQFDFPPMSRVSDYRPTSPGYDAKRGSDFYIIKANGDKRSVSFDERFKSIDELLTTDGENQSEE